MTSVFELWRQDDNGNRVLMSAHADHAAAEAALREWESGPQHKQLYFLKERPALTEGRPSDTAPETPRPPR